MILLADVGGTRLKLGRLHSYDLETSVQETPGTLREFVEIIEQESATNWALALPGQWDHKADVWSKPFIWEEGPLSREEIGQRFHKAPAYITNDLSAAAWGLGGSWACLLLSTGTGVRVLREGRVVMDQDSPYLADFIERSWQGRSMREWLSWRGMQGWMPGPSWREVGQNPPRELLEAVRYFADSLQEEVGLPTILLGGGAQALRPHLPRYRYPSFDQPALRGLWRGLVGQNHFSPLVA